MTILAPRVTGLPSWTRLAVLACGKQRTAPACGTQPHAPGQEGWGWAAWGVAELEGVCGCRWWVTRCRWYRWSWWAFREAHMELRAKGGFSWG
eukprot:3216890-Pleurochrysis_carterae.AAC.1